jgi:hypothetical protein
MNTTTWAVGTTAVVVAGRWATEKPLDIKLVVGLGAYAIGLSIVSSIDADIAAKLSAMVFFLACVGPDAVNGGTPTVVAIAQKLGLSGGV